MLCQCASQECADPIVHQNIHSCYELQNRQGDRLNSFFHSVHIQCHDHLCSSPSTFCHSSCPHGHFPYFCLNLHTVPLVLSCPTHSPTPQLPHGTQTPDCQGASTTYPTIYMHDNLTFIIPIALSER